MHVYTQNGAKGQPVGRLLEVACDTTKSGRRGHRKLANFFIFSTYTIFNYDEFFSNLRSKSTRFWMGQTPIDAITVFVGQALLVAVKMV